MIDGSTKRKVMPITGGPSERIGMIGWLILYASGAILFFLLLIHVLTIHFFGEGQITAASVRADASSWILIVVNIGLLVMGLLHGLIGFFRIAMDLEIFGAKESRWFKWILYITGAGLTVFGIVVFSGLSAL